MSGLGPREGAGTVVGAGTGALLGAAVAGGGAGNRLAGAAIGGVLGGLIGNRIGASLDDEDKQRAYAAQMDALEREAWSPGFLAKPRFGALWHHCSGCRLPAGRPQVRAFTHTIYIDGQPQTARGTACRNPDDVDSRRLLPHTRVLCAAGHRGMHGTTNNRRKPLEIALQNRHFYPTVTTPGRQGRQGVFVTPALPGAPLTPR